MDALTTRVLTRFRVRYARTVRILIDRDATNKIRQRFTSLPNQIVAEFDSSFTLYRIFDGEELVRILKTGQITGGTYSTPAERAHGASWAENVTEVIEVGNRLRGGRYGDDLFLAKYDAIGTTFHHLDPKVEFDPNGPEKQPAVIDANICNFGLGCSMTVGVHDVDLFVVHPDHKMVPMSIEDAKEYVAKRPVKDIDLREVHPKLFQGSILGVDVRVTEEGNVWKVLTNDGKVIVDDAPSKDDAIETARIGIHLRPSNPIPTSFQILQQKRKHEKLFEVQDDPNKIRGEFALKPRDTIEVLKGSRDLDIGAREKGTVADVWQDKGGREVRVKIVFRKGPVTLYATHPNRLSDDQIALMNSQGDRILVRRR
jgi:hypothetical protein